MFINKLISDINTFPLVPSSEEGNESSRLKISLRNTAGTMLRKVGHEF